MYISFAFLYLALFFIDKSSFEGISFAHAIDEWIKYLELSYTAVREAGINENKKHQS